MIRLGRCFVYFLLRTTDCPVIPLFALVAFLPICRALSWFVNSFTKFTFLPIHDLRWSLLIFFLLSIIWSSFLFCAFFYFWFLDMPPTSFLLFISFICIFAISSIRHMLIAFSSVISTNFLSRISLILSNLILCTTLYSSKLSCKSPHLHTDARFLSSFINWSNILSSCWFFQKNFLLSTTRFVFNRQYSSNLLKIFFTVMPSSSVWFLRGSTFLSHSIVSNISLPFSPIKNRKTLYFSSSAFPLIIAVR